MTERFAVTGTDTGVGKTVVACALAALARRRGLQVAVMKPVESGLEALVPVGGLGGMAAARSDAERLRDAAGSTAALDVIRPFAYGEPLAPMVAAAHAGRPIAMAELDRCLSLLEAGADLILVEGAGGVLVPLDATTTYADLFVRWNSPVLLVAGNRLGVLNHTLLTVRAIEAAGLSIRGIVLTELAPPDVLGGDPSTTSNFGALHRLLPHLSVFQFPWMADIEDAEALASAAAAAGLDRILSPVDV